ncbi:hypothetical protein FACS189434_14570 [Bacteroidia bacterium]|nr:hypothetical protein FACS189434_14570 [Bacteroidia bacterium]
MSEYATKGAMLTCTCGAAPSQLQVTSNTFYFIQGNLAATTNDKAPMVNIMPFGTCTMKPSISGFLPCVPAPTVWASFLTSVQVGSGNPLLKTSTIQCAMGGCISFQNSGQMKPQKVVINPNSPQIDVLKRAAKEAVPFCEECEKKKSKEKKARAVDVYWVDEDSEERHYEVFPDYEVTLYIETIDYTPGETLTLDYFSPKGKKFKGNKDKLTVSGKVEDDGIVCVKNFKVEYEA